MNSFITDQKDKSIQRLKGDKQRLQAEVEELEKKIDRMNTMRTQVGVLPIISGHVLYILTHIGHTPI